MMVENHPDGSVTCRPGGPGSFPAVLYSHGGRSGAVGGDLEGTCRALAEAGYLARAERRPDSGDLSTQLEDVTAGLDALLGDPSADADSVGVVGFSRGGLLSLQLATGRPMYVKAVVLMAPAPGRGALERTLAAVDPLTAAVLLLVSENDTRSADHVLIARTAESVLRAVGKEVDLIVYPPFEDDGHRLFFEVRDSYWADLLAFLARHL